jgi:tripartite-type tricarboxylate transporter receptor subunit TctC
MKKHMALALAACAAFAVPHATAQSWPSRPVKLIVTAPPGGPPDILARSLALRMHERFGQPFVVENRPGANSIIGMDACAKAQPDGYTVCISTNDSVSVNPHLYAKLPYDPVRSFEPVAMLAWPLGVIVVTADTGVKSFGEVVALSKAKPSRFFWGSFGNGSTSHLYLEWIRAKSGWQVTHVPFLSTANMIKATLAGEVQLTYLTIGPLRQHIASGKLVPIAVAGLKRTPLLPQVPTFSEVGLGDFFVRSWFGMFAPAGTPGAIVHRLNLAANEIVNDPAFQKSTLDPLTLLPGSGSAQEVKSYMEKDRKAGAELVKAAKVRMD